MSQPLRVATNCATGRSQQKNLYQVLGVGAKSLLGKYAFGVSDPLENLHQTLETSSVLDFAMTGINRI